MSWTTPFDASRDFIVRTRGGLINGRRYATGDAFDKSDASERLLRLLYENRIISYPDEAHPHRRVDPLLNKAEAREAKRANKAKPTEEQLAAAEAFAKAPGNTAAKLLELAEGLDTVRPGMVKKAIALELIRAGRVPS